jgi:adenosylmethionine-8-amino-7-oxononanoate aminotransferase
MLISGNISSDHVHMLISVPPNQSLSKIVQYIKEKSSRKLQQEFEILKKKYWGQHLWATSLVRQYTRTCSTDKAWKKGIFIRPLGKTIYLFPPYCISNEDLERTYSAINRCLCEFA